MALFDTQGLAALAQQMVDEDVELVRPKAHHAIYKEGWGPNLNPIQACAVYDIAIFKLYYGERGSGKCRSINDLCYQSDGLSRLGNMNPGVLFGFGNLTEAVWSFDGEKLLQKNTSAFYRESLTDAKEWCLSNGNEIVGSPIHPVWCCVWKKGSRPSFRYVRLCDFESLRSEGWRIWTPLLAHPGFTRSHYRVVCGVEINPQLGYCLGALCGDGGLSQIRRAGVSFTNMDDECISLVNEGLRLLGSELVKTKSSKSGKATVFRVSRPMRLGRILEIGKMACTSYHKVIPDFIISSPKSVLSSFLRGLFDTDGTVEKAGTISLTTTSHQLSRDVQDCLMALGVFSVRRPKKSASGKPTWNIYVMGSHVEAFAKEVGFSITRKQLRIKVGLKHNHNDYTYPEAICEEMRKIALATRTGLRKPRGPVRYQKIVGPRKTRWVFNKPLPWGHVWETYDTEEEAKDRSVELTKQRDDYLQTRLKDRAWHNKHRSIHAFRYVPGPDKLRKFIALYDCEEQLKPFLISDTWVEVTASNRTRAQLADLSVPGTHSFLCGGVINHNTIGGCHELVDYCYRNENGLAYVIVREVGMGTEGGAWHKLKTEVIPEWEHGLGIQVVFATDFQTKSPLLWISNRHGGWSCAMLKSLPVAAHVEAKVRGREPGFILVDEAQTLESDDYFKNLLMQLGRRKGSGDPGRIVFCCNPEGPSHWLYHRFFELPVDEKTGEWDYRYAKWHIPVTDNLKNLEPHYYENYVIPAVENDPIAYARLVKGEWVDRPDGTSLLGNYFSEAIHVKGDAAKGIGMVPVTDVPMIISWDPGAAHTCIAFEQMVATVNPDNQGESIYILLLDGFDFVGEYKSYKDIVPLVIERQLYWEKKMGKVFRWHHAADSSAFNQYRAATGSFDVWDIEKLSRAYVEQRGLDPRFVIKMQESPKAEHSIAARVRMLTDALVSSTFFISATCPKPFLDMFYRLQADPEDSTKPKKKARYGHDFDAITYGPFWAKHRPRGLPAATAAVTPQYWSIP